jgi:hypothetical protein
MNGWIKIYTTAYAVRGNRRSYLDQESNSMLPLMNM